jgi:ligand-binding sensor domain-containing protein/two-component sensor histidine kinase
VSKKNGSDRIDLAQKLILTFTKENLLIPQMRNILFAMIYLFALADAVHAQNIDFQTYNSEKGLSQNSGYCIAQDANGYLWMGTQDGLNKFNGRKIITYYKETISRGQLNNNFIRSLFFDSVQNWLWVGTNKGLTIYDIEVDSFYNASHFFSGADTLNGLMIGDMKRISQNEIAVCTFSEGLFICNTQTRKTRQFLQSSATKNRTRAVIRWGQHLFAIADGKLQMLLDSTSKEVTHTSMGDVRYVTIWQNNLWIASADKGLFKITNSEQPQEMLMQCGSSSIGVLLVDQQNNLWIGSRDKGLIVLEPKNYTAIYAYETAVNQTEWPKKFTLSLFEDRQKIVWVGSSGGGFASTTFSENVFRIIRKKEEAYGKEAHNMILSMQGDGEKILYLGTQLEGMRIYNTVSREMTVHHISSNIGSNSIYGITTSSPKDVWLATANGLHHFSTEKKIFTRYVEPQFEASLGGQSVNKLKNRDSLLYSCNHGAILFDLKNKKFNPIWFSEREDSLKNLVINSILQEDENNVWIGCQGYGLVKYSFIDHHLTLFADLQSISNNIYCIKKINGFFWLGSANGLIVYDVQQKRILKIFNAANDLGGNVVYSIEQDAQQFLWCSTNVGLIKINPTSYQIVHIPASAGLQASEFNAACSFKNKNGELFFGGINGVSYFNPSSFSVPLYSPQPTIESFSVFNKGIQLHQNVSYAQTILLAHNQNFITIEFGVNNFINNGECVFKYKLEGAESDWVFSGKRNYASYTNLLPGKYVLWLQSANSGGVWNKEATKLTIIIEPIWYQTIGAKILAALAMLSIIFFLIRRRISFIRKESARKQQMAETEMQALRAQMNPHFIFNSLNSIENFIMQNERRLASDYLNKFSRLIRCILDSSRNELVPVAKDMEALQLYLELEQLRFNNKFSYIVQIDPILNQNDYRVPTLLIQTYVENAIVHGIAHSKQKDLQISIVVKALGENIQYIIEDNGVGRNEAMRINEKNKPNHKSVGLEITANRIVHLNALNPIANAVVFTDLYDASGRASGTSVKITIKAN